MRRASRRARGFTLIEVLVALVIVALGMSALLGSVSSSADTTIFLRDKMLGQWLALNQITLLRMKGMAPPKGKSEGDVEDFANRRWHWQQDVEPTDMKGVFRIDVSVRPADVPESKKNVWYATETGIMGDTVDYSWDPAVDWSATAALPNPAKPPNPNAPGTSPTPTSPGRPTNPSNSANPTNPPPATGLDTGR